MHQFLLCTFFDFFFFSIKEQNKEAGSMLTTLPHTASSNRGEEHIVQPSLFRLIFMDYYSSASVRFDGIGIQKA